MSQAHPDDRRLPLTRTRCRAGTVTAVVLTAALAVSGCTADGGDEAGSPGDTATEGGGPLDPLVQPLPDDGVISSSGLYECAGDQATVDGEGVVVMLQGPCASITIDGAGARVLATDVNGSSVTVNGDDTTSILGTVSALTVHGDNADVVVVGSVEVQGNGRDADVTTVPDSEALGDELDRFQDRLRDGADGLDQRLREELDGLGERLQEELGDLRGEL